EIVRALAWPHHGPPVHVEVLALGNVKEDEAPRSSCHTGAPRTWVERGQREREATHPPEDLSSGEVELWHESPTDRMLGLRNERTGTGPAESAPRGTRESLPGAASRSHSARTGRRRPPASPFGQSRSGRPGRPDRIARPGRGTGDRPARPLRGNRRP